MRHLFVITITVVYCTFIHPAVMIADNVTNALSVASEGLSLIIATDKNTYSTNDHIIVHITLTNNSTLTYLIVETGAERDFPLNVTDSNGKGVPLTSFGKQITERKAEFMRVVHDLPPDKNIKRDIDLAITYNCQMPGRYSIIAGASSVFYKKSIVPLVSNKIEIVIK